MTTRDTIAEWFKLGLNGGFRGDAPGTYSHMIVVCDEFDYSDYPHFVYAGDDPAKYTPGSMQRVMECYDLRLPMESQLDERRAFHANVACGLSDWSPEWTAAVSPVVPASIFDPSNAPVVMEADPEIEALLREDEEIQRQVQKEKDEGLKRSESAITPMTGEGWYRVYEDGTPAEGPYDDVSDLAEIHVLTGYPKDGYIVYSTISNNTDGKFWMLNETVTNSELDTSDFLPHPTWRTTLTQHGMAYGLASLIGTASKLEYDYFAWNGQVYRTVTGGNLSVPVCLEDEVK